ncbi:hypothetical protein B484DRAFT_443815 [Ochromonadaceae sp. CCMP2298]|nr:hypothetical protein B484DRAFT_443815 [Ochromonadaceae sp. CCMP2298]
MAVSCTCSTPSVRTTPSVGTPQGSQRRTSSASQHGAVTSPPHRAQGICTALMHFRPSTASERAIWKACAQGTPRKLWPQGPTNVTGMWQSGIASDSSDPSVGPYCSPHCTLPPASIPYPPHKFHADCSSRASWHLRDRRCLQRGRQVDTSVRQRTDASAFASAMAS